MYEPGQKISIHTFTDASSYAYAGQNFMVTTDKKGETHVSLISARCRVFPRDEKAAGLHGSIPRKELVACVLGRELFLQVALSFQFPQIAETKRRSPPCLFSPLALEPQQLQTFFHQSQIV